MAKIEGTNGNDVLTGTDTSDEILGKKGNDIIRGKAGDDSLTGGAGKDTYIWFDGDGYDTIVSTGSAVNEDIIQIQNQDEDASFYDFNWTREGNDLLVGVVADDNYDFADVGGVSKLKNFFNGGDSIDYLTADVGDNNIFYSPGGGDSRLYVSAINGTDQGNYAEAVVGTARDDVLTGGGGFKDFMFGDDGDDNLSVENGTIGVIGGGNGDDIITGADMHDILRGGEGNDLIDGGDSFDDLVRYNNSPGGTFVNMSDEAVTFDFDGTPDVEVAAGQALDGFGTVDTILNVEHVRGSNFDDIIVGNGEVNAIEGLAGDDIIKAGTGDDTLIGGTGIDTYLWSEADGYDTIGSAGAPDEDIIRINGTFYDYNFGFDGNDLLIGVTADDSYDFATVGGSLRIQDFFSGGDSIEYIVADVGANNIFYNRNGDDVPAQIYLNAVTGVDQGDFTEAVYGTNNDDVMAGGGGFRDWLRGRDGDDIISVENGTQGFFRGGNGDDTLNGADQRDTLRGDAGNDVMDGGENADLVQYNNGPAQGVFVNLSDADATLDFNGTEDVTVAAGQAIDNWGDVDTLSNVENVRGSSFDDIIVGNEASNIIEGGVGADRLDGGGSADELYGADGDDTLLGGDGDDYLAGADGTDHLEGGEGTDTLEGGTGGDTIEGGGGADALWGGDGDDLILGGDGDDIVNAEAGDDTVFGGDGDDILTVGTFSTSETNYVEGGAGDDQLQGGFGSDTHWGGAGNDLMIDGGEGSDLFIFKNNLDEGDDRIDFFKAGNFPGSDQLALIGFGFDDWNDAMMFAAADGSDVLFSFDNATTVRLTDVALADLQQNNFVIAESLLA